MQEKYLADFKDDAIILLEEEKQLLQYYASKLLELCVSLKAPPKVMCTSCTFLHRFYTTTSALEFDPQLIALTCFYVASKVEDHYYSAEDLQAKAGMPAEIILKLELSLLQGLRFDLQVHPPQKAYEGVIIQCQNLSNIEEADWKRVKEIGMGCLQRLLTTDAVLLYTPGQLGLKALQIAFKEFGREDTFAKCFELLCRGQNREDIDGLTKVLQKIDEQVAGANAATDNKETALIDRRLKMFLKAMKTSKKQ